MEHLVVGHMTIEYTRYQWCWQ